MRLASSLLTFIVVGLCSVATFAQEPSASVPRLINITGVFRPADGQAPAAVETVTLAIYADEQGGAPLWQETQTVNIDERGRYSLLLGATVNGGIPSEIFGSNDAHWLGTRFERAGEVEGARVRLTSVPYALRAAAADTLGGRPASDYQLATGATGDGKSAPSATRSEVAGPTGTANFLPKYVDGVNFGDSALYESGGQVGLGTTTPFDMFHIRFNNPGGNFTGLAVQNTANTATSFSGMLFFDQNNQLGQFQGFNNVTHEYRINNIARVTPGGAFDGSINFMVGSTSRFFVGSNGRIGIGTTAPSTNLDISNALTGTAVTDVNLTSFGSNNFGSLIAGRKARGTAAAPTAAQSGDSLAIFGGRGYGTTGFSSVASGLTISAAENWTDTAQGTNLNFATTPTGTTGPLTRMTINAFGNVGIGTFGPASALEVSNAITNGPAAQVTATTYTNAGSSLFVVSRARGTSAAPLAVQNGDNLGGFLGRGFFAGATTGFSGTRGGMFVSASENWTDVAQGTRLVFNTTPNGTTAPGTRMMIDGFGNVGVGTLSPNGLLEVAKTGTAEVLASSFGGEGSAFKARGANGTFAAPAATVLGDQLGAFSASGYNGTTGFNETAGMAAFAAENFTDTAQGTALAFYATPVASNEAQLYMALMPNGNVGVNPQQFDVNGFPIVNDRLQVWGDVRIGTTGTNGCIKNFAGTGIIGTCSSDRRLKKNVTPFSAMLDKVSALQPVHYFWRSDEFPDRHFGNALNYGLIAQDVEQVLPELVSTDGDGYEAVDYSKLPLLTIQAVKELKAENDELKQEVAELKRMMNELLASTRR